jgi:hypothetical protein
VVIWGSRVLGLWTRQLWWFLVRLFVGERRCFSRPQALPVELKGPLPDVSPVRCGRVWEWRTVQR